MRNVSNRYNGREGPRNNDAHEHDDRGGDGSGLIAQTNLIFVHDDE